MSVGASSAWAQSGTTATETSQTAQLGNPIQVTVASPSGRDFVTTPINNSACSGTDFPIQITYNTQAVIGVTAQARLQIFLLNSTGCLTATPTTFLYNELLLASSTPSGTFPSSADTSTLSQSVVLDLGDACDTQIDSAQYAICVIIDNVTTVAPTKHLGFLPINIDTKPPGVPTDVKAEPSDSSVVVSWTAPSDDVNSYVLTTINSAGVSTTQTTTVTNARVEGLTNGETYSFTVHAVDAAGNTGAESDAVSGAPRDECNFWKCYEGQERGGCSSTSDVAWVVLLTVLLLVAAKRRARRVVPRSAWFVLALALGASPAYASSDSAFADDMGENRDEDYSAPRDRTARPWLGFNLKFGSYRPNIDSDPAANNIYALFFGQSDKYVLGAGRKVRGDLEADFYILRSFGLLGLSGSIGYWQATGKTRVCSDATGAIVACSAAALPTATPTNDNVNFTMFPFSVSLVYKFDFLLEKWSVPLVPYFRVGMDLVLWRVDSGGKEAVRRDKRKGNGLTYGWHFRPGLAINLDWIEPDTARRAFHAAGIHGTYLTFEWIFNDISDFKSRSSWDLSDSSFLAGVSIDLGF